MNTPKPDRLFSELARATHDTHRTRLHRRPDRGTCATAEPLPRYNHFHPVGTTHHERKLDVRHCSRPHVTTDGRTRFDLYAPESPAHPTNPQRVASAFITGPMALANAAAIFAVVPRTSPLAVLPTVTLCSHVDNAYTTRWGCRYGPNAPSPICCDRATLMYSRRESAGIKNTPDRTAQLSPPACRIAGLCFVIARLENT